MTLKRNPLSRNFIVLTYKIRGTTLLLLTLCDFMHGSYHPKQERQ